MFTIFVNLRHTLGGEVIIMLLLHMLLEDPLLLFLLLHCPVLEFLDQHRLGGHLSLVDSTGCPLPVLLHDGQLLTFNIDAWSVGVPAVDVNQFLLLLDLYTIALFQFSIELPLSVSGQEL